MTRARGPSVVSSIVRCVAAPSIATFALPLLLCGGCPNSVGLGDVQDQAVPVEIDGTIAPPVADQSVVADLSAVVDLSPPAPDATTCAASCSGCCDDQGSCHSPPAVDACGAGGQSCTPCGADSDSCTAGHCGCGGGPACATGQRCTQGRCRCDAQSCSNGCCDVLEVCRAIDLDSCAAVGGKCATCDKRLTDSCVGGACHCGTAAPCAAGQRCVNGACQCDGTSCPKGCCSGNFCAPGTSSTECGSGGGACMPCTIGGQCSMGVCSGCNAASCPNGCCSGNVCQPSSTSTCGSGGHGCSTCGADSDSCSGGACLCGNAPACGVGLECNNGLCRCTSRSCDGGCCSQAGTTCNSPSVSTCGSGGSSCSACDLRSDGCTAGSCTCGGGPPCPANLQCVGGQCACTPASCTSGCCRGNGFGSVCVTATSTMQCGVNGSQCQICSQGQLCISGTCGTCGKGAKACPSTGRCVASCASCPSASFGCPSGGTISCVSSCAACSAAPLACDLNALCVSDCKNSCGFTRPLRCQAPTGGGGPACVQSCRDACNGFGTCVDGSCVADCTTCTGGPKTCTTATEGVHCINLCTSAQCTGLGSGSTCQ